MTIREVLGLAGLYVVALYFLIGEIHTAFLIHSHFKRLREEEEHKKNIEKPSCETCIHFEWLDKDKTTNLCKITGFLDIREACECYEKL